jgi:hypothetical protein
MLLQPERLLRPAKSDATVFEERFSAVSLSKSVETSGVVWTRRGSLASHLAA